MNAEIDIKSLIPTWQALQSAVPLAHIDGDAGYARAVALMDQLLDVVRDDENHPLFSLVSVVGDVIEAYEIDHEPVAR